MHPDITAVQLAGDALLDARRNVLQEIVTREHEVVKMEDHYKREMVYAIQEPERQLAEAVYQAKALGLRPGEIADALNEALQALQGPEPETATDVPEWVWSCSWYTPQRIARMMKTAEWERLPVP